MNKVLAGSLSGFVATVPMSAAMLLMHRRLPWPERYSLPPHQITMELAEQSGIKQHLDAPKRSAATVVSHFGYGAAAGAVYAPLAEKVPAHPALKGVAFGFAVWAASYLGWLPATGMLNIPADQSSRRNGLMIAAHVVWGLALGLLMEQLSEGQDTDEE